MNRKKAICAVLMAVCTITYIPTSVMTVRASEDIPKVEEQSTVKSQKPAPVEDISTTQNGEGTVEIRWKDTNDESGSIETIGYIGYKVYLRTDDTDWKRAKVTMNTFTTLKVKYGRKYTAVVRPYRILGIKKTVYGDFSKPYTFTLVDQKKNVKNRRYSLKKIVSPIDTDEHDENYIVLRDKNGKLLKSWTIQRTTKIKASDITTPTGTLEYYSDSSMTEKLGSDDITIDVQKFTYSFYRTVSWFADEDKTRFAVLYDSNGKKIKSWTVINGATITADNITTSKGKLNIYSDSSKKKKISSIAVSFFVK